MIRATPKSPGVSPANARPAASTTSVHSVPYEHRLMLAFPAVGFLLFVAEALVERPNPLWVAAIALWSATLTAIVISLQTPTGRTLIAAADRHAGRLAAALILVFAATFVCVSVLQTVMFALGSHAEDSAYYGQVLWNTLHGRLLWGNLQQERLYHPAVTSDLALHVSPALLALLPAYALAPHPLTLMILRDIAIASAAWPLFLLARELLGGAAGLVAVVLYLANAAVVAQAAEALYLLQFAPLPFFFALRAFARSRLAPFAAWVTAAMALREDVAIAVAGFGVLALVTRRRLPWLMCGLGLPVAWWLLATLVIQPQFGRWGNSALDVALAAHGPGPVSVYGRLLDVSSWLPAAATADGLQYLYRMLRTVGVLPLLGLQGALALPSLTANLFLSSALAAATVDTSRFALLPACALVGSSILAASRLARTRWKALLAAWLALVPSASLLDGAKDAVQDRLRNHTVWNDAVALRQGLAFVPAEASVAAPHYALPALANRRRLYYLQYLDAYPGATPEYVLLDRDLERVGGSPERRTHYAVLLRRLTESPDYTVIWSRKDYLLIRRVGVTIDDHNDDPRVKSR